MKDVTVENLADVRQVLREAEKAYNSGDQAALGKIALQIPTGYTLVILKSCEHGPCFTILPIEGLSRLESRFRIVTSGLPVVSSVSAEGSESNPEPDRPSLEDGILRSVEPGEENGRGNLQGGAE